jgi:acyl transferase domain-containing protein/3-hydroxymyristoyl/3-hydroxydecanoyl-(acyl carrier protein) dehydratase
MTRDERVAIVGIGGIFPRSPDLAQFWANIEAGVAATKEVPPARWLLDPADAYDPRVGLADHVYSTRGCFVEDFTLDLAGLDVDPALLDRLDPIFHLALHAGKAAWNDARMDAVDRSKVGVVFGNLVLPTETASKIASETLGRTFEESLGFESAESDPFEPLNTRMAGLPAGLLAKALGLGGGAYTIDAACASSLYALKLASDELLEGRADAMLTGGLSRPDPLYTQIGFSQLRALSPTGTASPFGEAADGLVVGEGSGMFVLKRLSDAIRHGDQIYSVIAGIGLSNDVGGGLLAPHSEGQLRAMRAAYQAAGWKPQDIDLIECHATGTPIGDAVEFASLRTLWSESKGETGGCVIGSVKSNVGHALTAAGSAGLLKVLLALKNEVLPPTAGFVRPAPGLAIESSPFRVLAKAEPWAKRPEGQPRRIAISGFGFGGINAHVLIEEWDGSEPTRIHPPANVEPIAIVGMAAHFGPFEGLRAVQERLLGGSIVGSPTVPQRWWGAEKSDWFAREGLAHRDWRSYRIDAVKLPTDRFRIPPKELEEMLPQQSLLLRLAAEAIDDTGWDEGTRLKAGCIVGLGLDLNSTNFHVRWSMLNQAREWNERFDLGLSEEALNAWVEELRDTFGPALTANRTMGALGSIVASRVAREFRLGGPSFTVSSEETSGYRAIDVAVGMLRRGDLDQAIVGAVDLPGDLRASIAEAMLRPEDLLADGAAVLVLKRLSDAERDGDKVYALIQGIGLATGGEAALRASADRAIQSSRLDRSRIGYVDSELEFPDGFQASSRADLGHTGAASGLASVIKAALCLHQQILPSLRTLTEPRSSQFWLRDRVEGPRRAIVGGSGIDGNAAHLILESYEPDSAINSTDRIQPTGPLSAALFAVEADDEAGLLFGLDELESRVEFSGGLIEELACVWLFEHPAEPSRKLALAIIATDSHPLLEGIATARRRVQSREIPARSRASDRVAYTPRPLGPKAGLAFVCPGMGNHFAGMGRELSSYWPEILRNQDARNDLLKSQMAGGTYWNEDPPETFEDHRSSIFGQVSLGIFLTDLLTSLGVKADASIGYSLGETTALFSFGAWTDRDMMFRRFDASPLFQTDLAGPCNAARAAWNLSDGEPVDWVAGILQRPSDLVRKALEGIERADLLIVNTDGQVVVGGQREAIARLVERVGGRFHPLPLVSTVHSEIVREVEQSYHDLHLLATTPPPGVRFYSGSSGESYPVDRESAAGSILAHALHGVDFPSVIRQAYADGVRAFIEVGPGASCTRMIGEILEGEPHLAASACPGEREPLAALLAVLARLISERFPVDLMALHGRERPRSFEWNQQRLIVVEPGGRAFQVEPVRPTYEAMAWAEVEIVGSAYPTGDSTVADPLLRQLIATDSARGGAHEAFLRGSSGLGDIFARQLSFQMELIERLTEVDPGDWVEFEDVPTVEPYLDRDQCLTFAVGRIGDVLGPEFAAIDADPTRVRLPDEPLMLVDRIMEVEGVPRSMTTGRVVTEHDVLPGLWYLDSGRIPTCIAVEAGQADLFLSAYLGIDFETKGLAVYRLLDAVVEFHDELPTVGQVIHYDIHIDGFFRQGDSRLFRFRFEATVDGRPLMTMSQGCAGFFTNEALDAGQGVVKTALDLRSIPGIRPDDWSPLVPIGSESLEDAQVEALREGDLVKAFGRAFEGLNLHQPTRLPGGLMRLVDRVLLIDPSGGRFGLGLIRGEADIRPDDWYMTCHFVDDRVMPGTLMYECCLHTLRIFLARMGWIGEDGEVSCQPVPGVASKLKCRGQVIESTKTVTYEVSLKEIGYRPEPYVIVDALMFADGKPIVEITDMSLRMTGLDREKLESIWAKAERPALYDTSKILAFAIGKPSEAFGDRYRIFDEERLIARLPGPPYQFLDRVVEVSGDPWKMVAGARAVAEYDVPADAWYFEADRQEFMPFAVLLETALQPCGWLAAYVGSALTSDVDLSFRNLGGSAVQLVPIGRDIGTLATDVTLTKVSKSGGMIIQQYDFTMTDGREVVYQGETTFGFFSKQALANQVGIRDAILWDEPGSSRREAFAFPDFAPFPDGRWGMIDRVEEYHPSGGPKGLGYIKGTKTVDPAEWFFKAHFYQDPVCPGSLGLESFQQLLKMVAWKRWGVGPETVFESLGIGDTHRWTYRGQILPTDRLVTVRAVVTAVDDDRRWLKADGFLDVDGRVIYQMIDFTLKAGRTSR